MKAPTPKNKGVKRVPVSAINIAKAAERLLSQRLVSMEIAYIQRMLGASSTQEQIDLNVVAVRKMPWASMANPDWISG